MDDRAISRYVAGITPLSILSVLLFIALIMMSAATQNSALFGHLYSLLLVINIIGIVVLLALILLNLYKLLVQFRARVMGSRLTLRLLGMFVVLAVIPVTVVFFFSIQALNRGIDSWFDVKVEQAMDDALMLGRTAFDALKQDLVQTAQEMSIELEDTSDRLAPTALNYLREKYNVFEITLFTQDGKILASSGQEGPETESLVPVRPGEAILSQIRQGLTYANLDPLSDGELNLRVVVPVYALEVGAPVRILQVLQQLPNRYAKLGESVQSAFAEYEKLVYLRGPLKFGFILTLSIVALLTLLIAVSGAMFAARRLVTPIRDLAEGTEAVAQGNYRKQLPIPSQDEFGILVKSFNEMTQKIHRAQTQIRQSQQETELQRTYLETILAHLSSGVMSFDPQLRVQTHNSVATQILGIDLQPGQKKSLRWLERSYPHIAPFAESIGSAMENGQAEWQVQVLLQSQTTRKTLIIRGTLLPATGARAGGYVVVFDDVTALIQAQRDAAWGEVARRLAHEIKNPLTPIQLSAERIRHKCMAQLEKGAQGTVDRSTRTIIDQVESLKSMVNAFSEYARPVQMQRQPVDLNQLIQDVTELYNNEPLRPGHRRRALDIKLTLDDELPAITADPGRLRQVLHNLLLNAGDALANTDKPLLRIKTRCSTVNGGHYVELQILDNGPGFADGLMDRLFEPYVSSKEKGTGLGLAIVKKIIEEHNGFLYAENLKQGGASITVCLPLNEDATLSGKGESILKPASTHSMKERKA